MKNLYVGVLCLCIVLFSFELSAQQPVIFRADDLTKPKLFSHLPDTIPVTTTELNSLLSLPAGKVISTEISKTAGFIIEGQVISSNSKFGSVINSVVIRSAIWNNACFTLSRSFNEDGSISYRGLIMHKDYGDLFELQKQNGSYQLVKRDFYKIVNE